MLSQKSFVIKKLKEGSISRNEAIYGDEVVRETRHHITRLGAIIKVLRNEGYNIITENTKTDCIYSLNKGQQRLI